MKLSKVIWAYFNQNDIAELEALLSDEDAVYFGDKGERVTHLPHIAQGISQYRICFEDNICIGFSPCYDADNWMQCGQFYLSDDKNPDALKRFAFIKKHIRKTYTYVRNGAFYYGPGFCSDWKQYKYDLPVFLESRQVSFPVSKAGELLETIQKAGFAVKPDHVRPRDVDTVDLSLTDAFVIYQDAEKIIRKIIRKSIVRYSLNSPCIFAYTNKQLITFILDSRIDGKDHQQLVGMFCQLCGWASQE